MKILLALMTALTPAAATPQAFEGDLEELHHTHHTTPLIALMRRGARDVIY